MLGRVIIIFAGASLVANCAATAVLTVLGINPATLHLTQFYKIGYAAINAVLIPFGISGFIGGVSCKKALIRAFIKFQWWLATFILIGLNVFNVILAKRNRGDFIRDCQNRKTSLNRCIALADGSAKSAFIEVCAQGGAMLFLGIVLLKVGQRVYRHLSLEEETKNLLEKANFNENPEKNDLGRLPPNSGSTSDNINVNNNIGRYETNVVRQPSKAATVNGDLAHRQTNAAQNSPLRRNVTDPNFMTPYKGPTGNIPPKRYPTSPADRSVNRVNLTQQPSIGNAYTSRNYVGGTPQPAYPVAPPQTIYPIAPSQTSYPIAPSQTSYPVPQSQAAYPVAPPQRSLSTKPYVNPLQPSYATQIVIPPPPLSEVNEYNNDYDYNDDYDNYDYYNNNYKPKPYAPNLTRM